MDGMTTDWMGIGQLRDFFATVTYRPGWTFTVVERPGCFEGTVLTIRCRMENAYRPGTMVDLAIDTYLPPFRDEEQAASWLFWRLHRIEAHEVGEWLQVGGVRIRDPHAEERVGGPGRMN